MLYITTFMRGKEYPYDAFISHAVEDKMAITNELYERLKAAGLKVWYSGRELTIGEDVQESILKGLAASRYGIIIFSPSYISKTYTLRELMIFQDRDDKRKDVILPVLHQITIGKLATVIPDVVGRFALTIEPGNMDHVVKAIVEKIKPPPETDTIVWPWKLLLKIAACVLLVLSGAYGIVSFNNLGPPAAIVEAAVHERMEAVQRGVDNAVRLEQSAGAIKASVREVEPLYNSYGGLKNNLRNNYQFDNGQDKIKAAYRVGHALDMDVGALSPSNNYGFKSPEIFLLVQREHGALAQVRYTYVNTQPVTYSVDEGHYVGDEYHVTISYVNNLRSIIVTLMFPSAPSDLKSNNRVLAGHFPKETYNFLRSDDGWVLKGVTWREE